MSEIEDLNHQARATAQHHRDQYDASVVAGLRQLGRDIGQERTYEQRAQQYLSEQGY